MTREKLMKLLPEGMDAKAVRKLIEAIEAEGQEYREKAEQAQKALAEKERQAQESKRALEEMQAKYEAELTQAGERERDARFLAEVEKALRAKGAKSMKAAMALLDLEELKSGGDWEERIKRAIDELAASAEGAFLFTAEKTGRKMDIGGGRFRGGVQNEATSAIRRAAGLK